VELRVGIRNGLELRRLRGLEPDHVLLLLGRNAAAGAMPAVDLGPQAGAEAALGVQLDAVLLGQRDGQRRPGDEAALDEDRPEQAPRLLLLLQGTAELVFGDEAFGDQQLTKRPPGLLRSFHLPYIGANAA